MFGAIKTKIYKLLLKSSKNLKSKVIEIIEDENFAQTVKKIYLKGLKLYQSFIVNNKDVDLNELYYSF